MKKLLSILGVDGLISTSSTSLVICNDGQKSQNIKESTPQFENKKHYDINM
ncbi:lipoprotein [Spiroplasma endosymbiont of Polydrusus formosus]|uniref:lipoprotein n=1 Tax=Spiroplasma endosymbiont of Polydrusus formosus TaxID=3139326 RepID=UPI0035B51A1D